MYMFIKKEEKKLICIICLYVYFFMLFLYFVLNEIKLIIFLLKLYCWLVMLIIVIIRWIVLYLLKVNDLWSKIRKVIVINLVNLVN